jgi:hypothetical protein
MANNTARKNGHTPWNLQLPLRGKRQMTKDK